MTVSAGILTLQNLQAAANASNPLGLGAVTVTVANNAALQLDGTAGGSGAAITVANKAMQLQAPDNGDRATGFLNNFTGELRNVAGNNTWLGGGALVNGANVDLHDTAGTTASTVYIGSDAGTLDIVGGITGTGNGNAFLGENLEKVGAGTLRFDGFAPNVYTGTTNVQAGTLELNKTPGVDAFRGAVAVGDNVNAAVLRLDASEQMLNSITSFTVNSTGTLDASPAPAGANELQFVGMGGATAGMFTLTFNGLTTTVLNFNDTPATVQAALQALSTIGAGNVVVTGAPGAYFVAFTGALAAANQSQLVVAANLTGGTGASVTTVVQGVSLNETQFVNFNATAGTFTLSYNGQTTTALNFNADAGTVQAALQTLSTIGTNNVVVTGSPGAYNVTFAGAVAGADVNQLTANLAGLTVAATTNEVQAVTVAGSGLSGTFAPYLRRPDDGPDRRAGRHRGHRGVQAPGPVHDRRGQRQRDRLHEHHGRDVFHHVHRRPGDGQRAAGRRREQHGRRDHPVGDFHDHRAGRGELCPEPHVQRHRHRRHVHAVVRRPDDGGPDLHGHDRGHAPVRAAGVVHGRRRQRHRPRPGRCVGEPGHVPRRVHWRPGERTTSRRSRRPRR